MVRHVTKYLPGLGKVGQLKNTSLPSPMEWVRQSKACNGIAPLELYVISYPETPSAYPDRIYTLEVRVRPKFCRADGITMDNCQWRLCPRGL